jgi:outer membrane assembly lipoprotein YfiO
MNGRVFLLAACLAGTAVAQDGRKSFSLSPDGSWQQVQAPPPASSTQAAKAAADGALDRLAARIERDYDDGYDDAVAWLKRNRGSPSYDRGLYLAALALKGKKDPVRAFYYCDQLLDEFPDSPRFQDALELQYQLAELYFDGLKDKLLGVRLIARDDAAIEMLFRIQQRAPGSPVAEKALLRTADFYWADGQFDLASDAYQAYVKAYPRSPLVPQARLREAYANLAQFHGPAFDSTSVINARTLLTSLMADQPELAQQENLPAKLELADRQLARKLVIRADYYRRTGQPESAARLCRRAIELYPNLPETADARQMLARLEPASK